MTSNAGKLRHGGFITSSKEFGNLTLIDQPKSSIFRACVESFYYTAQRHGQLQRNFRNKCMLHSATQTFIKCQLARTHSTKGCIEILLPCQFHSKSGGSSLLATVCAPQISLSPTSYSGLHAIGHTTRGRKTNTYTDNIVKELEHYKLLYGVTSFKSHIRVQFYSVIL